MKAISILLASLIIVTTKISLAQTSIPAGDVSGNWTLNGSPYLINGEITIPNDSTLTIEPGVLVEFQSHYKLNVQGRLLAIGTETDTIVFTINDTTGFSNQDTSLGGWHGIRFNWTSTENDSSRIIYCKLQYGKAVGSNWPDQDGGAILVYGFDKLIVANSLITNNIAGGENWPGGGGLSILSSNPKIIGNTISNNTAFCGGGIQCSESSPLLSNNKFIANNTSEGGGIYIASSEVEIYGCDFIKNNALDGAGGGIRVEQSDLILNTCNFLDNESNTLGGGLRILNSNLQVENCTFENNRSNNRGGAIIYDADNLTFGDSYEIIFANNKFENNFSEFSSGGVQISQWNSETSMIDLTIDNCEFINNEAGSNAGLRLIGNISDFTLTNSYFISNTASSYTAGLGISSGGFGSVSNCLFASNVAATDGGSWNSGGVSIWSESNIDFMNCTFAYNTAAYGSGLTVGGGGIATTTNCIFWENSTNQIALASWNDMGGTITVNYCDIQGGEDSVNVIDSLCVLKWGNGNIDSDPMFEDFVNKDFHIQDNSPCIGAGINCVLIDDEWYCIPITDIEGNPRPNPTGSIPDMGAYENPLGIPVGIEEKAIELPKKFTLKQNYPNPFNPTTKINYSIPNQSFVTLKVFDVLGREIRTLINKEQSQGNYTIEFDAASLTSGIYFYRIQTGEFIDTKKMILLR